MQGSYKDSTEQPRQAEIFAARQRVFTRNRAATQLLFQASQMPQCQIRSDWTKPLEYDEKQILPSSQLREFRQVYGRPG
jgi:hypothetical protein